jgi:tRNA threonylcarbamoyladenosine biosynthesis protein TsaE
LPEPRVLETSGPEETEQAGALTGAGLRPGDVVLVSGELGAGKTTWVRGACRALGVAGPVTSPSFTIGQRYPGRVPVSHLDLYRLPGLREEDPGLLDDYLGIDRVAFLEWPEAALPSLERVTLQVSLAHLGGDRRRIEVVA